jgi:hypothetical protein
MGIKLRAFIRSFRQSLILDNIESGNTERLTLMWGLGRADVNNPTGASLLGMNHLSQTDSAQKRIDSRR